MVLAIIAAGGDAITPPLPPGSEPAAVRLPALGDQAVVLETTVVPATKATVDLVTEGWQAGKFDLFRVLQAAREAADARRTELEVLAELWRAVVELDRATGAS